MATVVAMPSMGYDMKEGVVVRWRKKEGEQVARGEVIAEIETDKATVEMEAYASGVLGKILAEEGASIPVGDLIAVITAPGEEVPPLENLTTEAPQEAPAEASEPSPPVATETATAAPAAQTGRVAATPIARRLAMELGVDLALGDGHRTERPHPRGGCPQLFSYSLQPLFLQRLSRPSRGRGSEWSFPA